MRKKQTRRHFFKNLGAIFCAILVIMAFIFESYGPYSKKSSPSQQCKQTKKSFFDFFELLVVINMEDLFQKNKTSQITSSNKLVSRIRKTVVRKTRQQKILQTFQHITFSRKPCFFVPNNTAYFLQKLLRPIER